MANITTKKIPSFDPFDVKKEIIDILEASFETNDIDVYESGFLGYHTQILTNLTSDMLFQNTMAYNEAFLGRAMLPSSIYNKTYEADYKVDTVIPAVGFLTIVLPVHVKMFCKILAGTKVTSSGDSKIPYTVKDNYYISQDGDNNYTVTSYDGSTGEVNAVSFKEEIRSNQVCIVFNIKVQQVEYFSYEIVFENPSVYTFYEEVLGGYTGQIHDMVVVIEGERYYEIDSIYQARSEDRVYEMIMNTLNNTVTLKFGNGIYGYQPKANYVGNVLITTSFGEKGNVTAKQLMLNSKVMNLATGSEIKVLSYNTQPIKNGVDVVTIDELRRLVKENMSAAKRLVTKNDYEGFRGVTNLPNVIGEPRLVRRDVVGNEVSFYNVVFGNDGNPVPTNTIPITFAHGQNMINKGTVIQDQYGVDYCLPFTLQIDTRYGVPFAKYIYTLSQIKVSPKLFTKSEKVDVYFNVEHLKAIAYDKVIPDPAGNSYTTDFEIQARIFKLPEMDPNHIKVTLKIDGNMFCDNLKLANMFQDNTDCIFSTGVKSCKDINGNLIIPSQQHRWELEIYYFDVITEEWDYYNSYSNVWEILRSGVNVKNKDSDVYGQPTRVENFDPLLPTYDFMSLRKLDYKVINDQVIFSTEIYEKNEFIPKINPSDDSEQRRTINPGAIDVILFLDTAKTYSFNLKFNTYTIDALGKKVYTFQSDYIDFDKLPIGPLDWDIHLYYNEAYHNQPVPYNTFASVGNPTALQVLEAGERKIMDSIISDPDVSLISTPNIEMVRIGVNDIKIESDTGSSFKFNIEVSRLLENKPDDITATLSIVGATATTHYNLENQGSSSNNTCNFITLPPHVVIDDLPEGPCNFMIHLAYKSETVCIYKQSATFYKDLSSVAYSNVIKVPGTPLFNYKALNVPVVAKQYYQDPANRELIDSIVMSHMVHYADKFTQFNMLTDRINLKFAKTFGKSHNVRLNKYNTDVQDILYPDDFTFDIPPYIEVDIFVSKEISKPLPQLIEECENVIFTFMQLKAGIHSNIYKSEISRFIHDTMEDVRFCNVKHPTRDIVFHFNLDKIPKTDKEFVYEYCPEYIWFQKGKIKANIKLID